jgi:flagella basal body P-ring formation protein FlgA
MMRVPLIALGFAFAQSAFAAPARVVTGAEISIMAEKILSENSIKAEAVIDLTRTFSRCDSELNISPRRTADWRLLKVSCAAPQAWTISVRTSSQAPKKARAEAAETGKGLGMAVVLNKSLARGTVITADDIDLVEVSITKGMQLFAKAEDVVGRKIKRSLSEGQVVRASHLNISWLIFKDSPVNIEAAGAGIQITLSGISLENGQLGDMIKVKNIMSGIIIDAFVKSTQKVSPVANIQ